MTPCADAAAGGVRGEFREALRLPGRISVRAVPVQQKADGAVCRVPLRLSGSARPGRARLTAEPGGDLGFLTGRRPLLAVALRDFRCSVGGARAARRTVR